MAGSDSSVRLFFALANQNLEVGARPKISFDELGDLRQDVTFHCSDL